MKKRELNKVVIKHRKYGGGLYQGGCKRCYTPLSVEPKFKRTNLQDWESCNDKVSTWTVIGMVGTFILILLFVVGRALLHS